MKNRVLLLCLATALGGCMVSQSKYDDAENARKAGEAALQSCKMESANYKDQLKVCTAANDKTSSDLTACKQESTATSSKAGELENRANELRDKLQTEISAKNVEIEQLKGKLSLHMLDRILFKSGSADILPEGKAALAKVAGVLAGTPELIRVEG